MALPVEFMECVVEWPGVNAPGYINAHWLAGEGRGPGMRGKPFKTLQEFMDFVQYAATKPGTYKEIFFCMSTQRETGRVVHNRATAARHASKAIAVKAIWFDLDVKPDQPDKAFASVNEALAALGDFNATANMPPPSALVLSGGGVHVYWISDRALTPTEWTPYAQGLKAEALRLGLKCDTGCTADIARVLRVPGTFNNKQPTPRPVKLAHLGASYDFAAAFPHLVAAAPRVTAPVTSTIAAPAATFSLPPEFAAGPAAAFAALDAGDVLGTGIGRGNSDLPLVINEVVKGCVHFQDCATTHGAKHPQGLWALTLLACSFFENGDKLARIFSKGYPTYDAGETDAKYAEKVRYKEANNLGWPSCKAFEGEGAACKTCPFYGKLRSPLHLAERVAPSTPPAATMLTPMPPPGLDLPEGYTVNDEGWICELVVRQDKDMTIEEHVPLFMSQLREFRAQAGDRKLLFETSLDGGRWGPASVTEGVDLVNETSIIKALRQFGVKPNAMVNPRKIIHFMTTFMAKLDKAKSRQQTVPFGWLRQDNAGTMPIGFAYGGRVVLSDGTTRVAGYSDMQLENFYKPKGDDKAWWELLHMITAQHHPALEAIVASSFAAPLQFATGLYNGIFCSWSNGSGAHKSTSIAVGAAVWGSPKLTKERPLSTQKGVIRKLGYLKNLPVFWDEINSDSKMDEVREILGSVTEGGGGSKLMQNRNLYEYEEWQTLIQIGANRSLVENILRVVKGTDAQLQRVFEYVVEKRGDTRKSYEIDRLVNALDYNYGHMGLKYSELLGRDTLRVDALVKDTLARFSTEVSMKSEERFRCAMATTTYVGALLANELGCNFNVDELWDFLKAEFLRQRVKIVESNIVAGTFENSLAAYSQFQKAFTDNVLHVDALPSNQPGKPAGIVIVAGPNKLRPRPIHIRMSISDRVIDVSKTKLTEWLDWMKYTPATVIDGLKHHLGAYEIPRVNLASGSGVTGGREPVLRIPVPPDSPLAADLYAHTPPEQRGGVTATVTGIDAAVAAGAAQAAADLAKTRATT